MSDRHSKWVRVEPGTVIPAGQPYRLEYDLENVRRSVLPAADCEAVDCIGHKSAWAVSGRESVTTFVDSSWKPPLVLPTTPTWGIAVTDYNYVGRWVLYGEEFQAVDGNWIKQSRVRDFIPLTPEQVQRIEAAR